MKDNVIPPRPRAEVEERISMLCAELCTEITNMQHYYGCGDLREAKGCFIKAARLFRSIAVSLVIPTYAQAVHVLTPPTI